MNFSQQDFENRPCPDCGSLLCDRITQIEQPGAQKLWVAGWECDSCGILWEGAPEPPRIPQDEVLKRLWGDHPLVQAALAVTDEQVRLLSGESAERMAEVRLAETHLSALLADMKTSQQRAFYDALYERLDPDSTRTHRRNETVEALNRYSQNASQETK